LGTHIPKLTQAALRRRIKKPGRYADGGGLYFRVIGEGKAYFVYRYWVDGREREASLGPYPELSLKNARETHAALRARVVKDKADPIAEKRAAKTVQATTALLTFGVMADLYIETHQGTWRNAKHRYQWKQTLTDYCRPIRDKPVDGIDTADVLAVLKPLWARAPETASRLRGRIQSVLDAAQALGHIPEDKANPARWKGHLAKLLPRPAKLSRGHQKALPYGDVPAFVKLLRSSNGMAALALEFLILTATRTGETLGAQWREIDLDAATWTVPASRMKTGDAFSVPLSERAVAIIADARRVARKEPTADGFVFPGVIPKRPLSNMALAMLMRRMDVDATAHGFRTSFRTWCSDVAHVTFEVGEACLSHRVGSAVSRAYSRSDMLERRWPVMAQWAAFLDGEAEIAAKIVSIGARRKRP
jgi:integrase